jgi:hypothetical protein
MPIPAGFAQVNWHFDGSGLPSKGEITLGLDVSDFLGSGEDIAEAASSEFEATILPQLANTVRLSFTSIKVGPDATGPTYEHALGAFGSKSGSAAAPNTAALCIKQTAFGGHAGRGRMFLPGIPEGDINEGGTLGGTYLAALQGAVNTFHTGWDGYNLTPVLLHGPGSPLSTPTPLTGMTVSATVATQRRRLRR